MDNMHTSSFSVPLYARRAVSGHLAARAAATSAVFAALAADSGNQTLSRSRVTRPPMAQTATSTMAAS